MIIDDPNLRILFTGYNAAFKKGFDRPDPFYDRVAMLTTSSTGENNYSWLGQFPRIREWIGDRVINNLEARSYTIVNRLFEATIAVPRTKIEDDQFGIYGPMFDEMGRDAAEWPNQLVAELLLNGFASPCYDGQYFFDTDHPVVNEAGAEYSVSNLTPAPAESPNNPAWYLIDGTRAVGSLVYQKRLDFQFQALNDDGKSDRVFFKDEYVYGLRGRANAGYGFWQLAHASRADLTPANYAAARTKMTTMRGDFDRKLGVKPNILLVPSELEEAGMRLINNERGANGETNPWKGSVELIVTPWLSA